MRKTVLLTLMTLLVAMACALPVIAQSDETAKRFHVFPQLADARWVAVFSARHERGAVIELLRVRITRPDRLDRFPEVSGITMSGSTATFEMDRDPAVIG